MPICTSVLRKIRKLTASNDHGGAYIEAAKALGSPDLADCFHRIRQEHLRLGELPAPLYDERRSFYTQLLALAKTQLGNAEYRSLYAAL